MAKKVYKLIFDIFEIKKDEKYRQKARMYITKKARDYYSKITGKKDGNELLVDEIWDILSRVEQAYLISNLSDYLLKFTDKALHKRIKNKIEDIFKLSLLEYRQRIENYNTNIEIIYKQHYYLEIDKKKAYENYLIDHDKVASYIEPLHYNEWLEANRCLKTKVEESKFFNKLKKENMKFRDWIKQFDEIKPEVINHYFIDFWLKENREFNDWFNQLDYEGHRIYDEIMDDNLLFSQQNQENYNDKYNYINENLIDKKIIEVTLKTIIKALKESKLKIDIDFEGIKECVNYIEKYDIDPLNYIENEEDSIKLIYYKNKLYNLDFYKIDNYI